MKITTFCLCILGTMLGMWLADLGAWASAGGIWVICIILAIDGAARPRVTKGEPERQRTLSTPGYTPPPPPPKKPANPFKVGDRVRDKITGASGTIDELLEKRALVNFSPIGRAGFAVPRWMYLEDLELICEKQF